MGPDSERPAFSKANRSTIAINQPKFFAELKRRNLYKVEIFDRHQDTRPDFAVESNGEAGVKRCDYRIGSITVRNGNR